MKRQFIENGFVMQRILNDDELRSLRQDYERVLSTSKTVGCSSEHSSSLQHLGDKISDFWDSCQTLLFSHFNFERYRGFTPSLLSLKNH